MAESRREQWHAPLDLEGVRVMVVDDEHEGNPARQIGSDDTVADAR
jgi:hypothetical protein